MITEYQKKIDLIIEEAVTNKTFSLDIIEKIKNLKEDVEALTEANDKWREEYEDLTKKYNNQLKKHTKLQEEHKSYSNAIESLNKEIEKWETREKELIHRETKMELVKQRADMERQSREEIKEVVSLVFRNPTFVKSTLKTEIMPPGQTDRNGYLQYPSQVQVTNKETETVE